MSKSEHVFQEGTVHITLVPISGAAQRHRANRKTILTREASNLCGEACGADRRVPARI
jgi:hypothetical protein